MISIWYEYVSWICESICIHIGIWIVCEKMRYTGTWYCDVKCYMYMDIGIWIILLYNDIEGWDMEYSMHEQRLKRYLVCMDVRLELIVGLICCIYMYIYMDSMMYKNNGIKWINDNRKVLDMWYKDKWYVCLRLMKNKMVMERYVWEYVLICICDMNM